ncbi:MAG: hypothetical protein OEW73_08015 [Gammaproteobacteria bacterium]|nr:hypothetical protein [Gammaproteobacteria bacterium]MDH5262254.1 hypothetical protein [Gammaproteobacteria bacterium]
MSALTERRHSTDEQSEGLPGGYRPSGAVHKGDGIQGRIGLR